MQLQRLISMDMARAAASRAVVEAWCCESPHRGAARLQPRRAPIRPPQCSVPRRDRIAAAPSTRDAGHYAAARCDG